MKNIYSRTFTVSIKISVLEKIRYYNIAKSHNISFSEWAASLLSIYENAYGELKINSIREEELLNEIEKLKRKINFLEAHTNFLETRINPK
jgi:hypothetical protein